MKAINKLRDLPFQTSLFLILAATITLLCGLVYMIAQQIYRQTANDPQIQISQDMAGFMSSGQDVKTVMPPTDVDMARSLVWFLTIYNDKAEIIASNGKLDGIDAVLPQGVLENAQEKGQNRVTWEPKEGVRIAAVITPYEGGYVLAGRNLRETESRIGMLGKKVLGVWVLSMIVTFLGTRFLLSDKKSH